MGQIIDFAKAKARRDSQRQCQSSEAALRYEMGISLIPEETVWDMMVAPTDHDSRYQDLLEFEIPHEVLTEIIYREGRRAQLARRAPIALKSFFWVVSNGEDEVMRSMARLAIASVDFGLNKLVNVSAVLSLLHGSLPTDQKRLKATYHLLTAALATVDGDLQKAMSQFTVSLSHLAGTHEGLILKKLVQDLSSRTADELQSERTHKSLERLLDVMLLGCDMEYLKFMPVSKGRF